MRGFKFIIIPLLLLLHITAIAQVTPTWQCADDKLEALRRISQPRYEQLEEKANLQLREYITANLQHANRPVFNGRPMGGDSVYTIPVVVHVVHPNGQSYGTGSNISYFQIRSQLEALNAAFSRDYAYNGQSQPGYAVDTRIRFCLARNTMPDTVDWYQGTGGIEYGVKRYGVDPSVYNHNITIQAASDLLRITHPDSRHFPFDKYLNIWLVNKIGGDFIMGYAPRPLTNGYPLDGVVMRADIFGDNTGTARYPLNFGLDQGKVLAHEVGHYFNLYHIFQDGCAGANAAGSPVDACDLNGDMICDIKPTTVQNVYCDNTVYNTCPINYNTGTTQSDMINNYMSYADDDCMNTFTGDQSKRMWATLNIQRHALWQPENLAATGILGTGGCIPPYLNALISSNSGVYCAGRSLHFSNPSAGNTATGFEWNFPGGTPGTAISSSSSVTYATAGNYTIYLTVNDGTNTLTDSLLISVVECNLDSSMRHMSNWYFGDFCSIDFSTGAPVLTSTALDHNSIQGESSYTGQLAYINATVSLSDSTGQLLFYSNGVSVWNDQHQKITSRPMFGASDINASSGICYIPYPGKPGKYFVAGVYPNFNEDPSGVRFVLVDVTADTVSAFQEFNHPSLPRRFSQYLTVVPHCNGTDYWIIAKGYGAETNFYSFLVNDQGINRSQAPVISSGFIQPGFGGDGYQLKANRQANMLVMTSPNPYSMKGCGALYSFDSRTGRISNERVIPDVAGYNNVQSGTAFSPNGEFIYLFRSSHPQNLWPYWLFQYRVSDLKHNIISTSGHYFAGYIQAGPDNQLYTNNGFNYLARISNPDKWGEAAFDGEFINLFAAGIDVRSGQSSLPAFIDARRPVPTHPEFSAKAVACKTFEFDAPCFDKYTAIWDFGDGTPLRQGHNVTHDFTDNGTYDVRLTLSLNGIIAGASTKKIRVLPPVAAITGPDLVCANSLFTDQYFGPVMEGVDYKWTATNGTIAGADFMSYTGIKWNDAFSTGTVRLEIANDNCKVSATKTVTILKRPALQWTVRDSTCVGDSSFQLQASPAGGIFSGPGISNNTFSPLQAGTGTHKIYYTYQEPSGCPGRLEHVIKVNDCVSTPMSVCDQLFNSISITPNVTNETLEISFPYLMKYSMDIYNSLGQLMSRGSYNTNRINVSRLSAGIYFAVIYCGSQNYTRAYKFFKF